MIEISTLLIVWDDLLLFFVSTAGDQELQQDMERVLARHAPRIDDKSYAVCELGNYFGYDDFDFGAEPILSHFLRAGGGRELVPPFSMDSFPNKNWKNLAWWCDLLNRAVAKAHA